MRGAGVGRLETAQREAARRSAMHLAGLAAQMAAFRSARVVLGPAAVRAAGMLRRVMRAAERTARAVDRLPSRQKLELEVATKAVALGVSVVQLALAPNVARAAQTAMRAAGLVRAAVRGDRER
jgi:hypothetical protein